MLQELLEASQNIFMMCLFPLRWKPGSSESQSCGEKAISLAILWAASKQQHPQPQKTLRAQRRRAMDQAARTHAQGSSPAFLRWHCVESKSPKCLWLSVSRYQTFKTQYWLSFLHHLLSSLVTVLRSEKSKGKPEIDCHCLTQSSGVCSFLRGNPGVFCDYYVSWRKTFGKCWFEQRWLLCILKHATFTEQLVHSWKFHWKATLWSGSFGYRFD